jgi:hypothetical protein
MSNPFAPPTPPGAYPQPGHGAGGQMWASPQTGALPQTGVLPQLGVPPQFGAAPKQGNGLAIAAVVMSGLALLGVIGLAVFFFVVAGSGGSWVLEGEVAVVDHGVADLQLEQALTDALEEDGSFVDGIRCPPRSQVGQGLVTVCRGSVDGWDWTGVVVFEDDSGSFIVTEY